MIDARSGMVSSPCHFNRPQVSLTGMRRPSVAPVSRSGDRDTTCAEETTQMTGPLSKTRLAAMFRPVVWLACLAGLLSSHVAVDRAPGADAEKTQAAAKYLRFQHGTDASYGILEGDRVR